MSSLGNKEIMASNLRRLMEKAGKDRKALCADLNLKYSTVSEWLNATAYPRIDKIELLANYFGVQKSDLVEYKPVETIYYDPEDKEFIDSLPPLKKLLPLSEKMAAINALLIDKGIYFSNVDKIGYAFIDNEGYYAMSPEEISLLLEQTINFIESLLRKKIQSDLDELYQKTKGRIKIIRFSEYSQIKE